FTQQFDCFFLIAVSLGQRLFAVHHAAASDFTQCFYVLSCKCHVTFLQTEISMCSISLKKAPTEIPAGHSRQESPSEPFPFPGPTFGIIQQLLLPLRHPQRSERPVCLR